MVAWRAAPVALFLLGAVGLQPALNPIKEPVREKFTMDMTSDLDPTLPVESTSAASLPLHAAVVEHTAAGSTIAVFDPKNPGLRSIVFPDPQPPDSLGWCAPKPLLLYSMGSRLLMHDGKEEELLQGLDKNTPTPFVCSPDGRFSGCRQTGGRPSDFYGAASLRCKFPQVLTPCAMLVPLHALVAGWPRLEYSLLPCSLGKRSRSFCE